MNIPNDISLLVSTFDSTKDSPRDAETALEVLSLRAKIAQISRAKVPDSVTTDMFDFIRERLTTVRSLNLKEKGFEFLEVHFLISINRGISSRISCCHRVFEAELQFPPSNRPGLSR